MPDSLMERLIPVIARTARLNPDEQVAPDTPIFGSGLSLDSATALEMLLAIEKEFGIELDPEALMAAKAMSTVGTFADFVGARVRERGHAL